MPLKLPPLRLTGARILRDNELQDRSVAIADGKITKGPLPEVDLGGYYVLPGIIDLHGDAFERHIAPRPSAPFPIRTGLLSTDREAAANGVTTAWLAQSWSWEGGVRGPDYAETVMGELNNYKPHALTDLRLQVRCETHLVDSGKRLLRAIDTHGIDYVVFNNHLDEAIELWHDDRAGLVHWAQKHRMSAEDLMTIVREAKAQSPEVPRHLCRLAEAFDAAGVLYGSHDDPDGETREQYSMIGAKICEFPTARPAAALAKAVGDPVLMGAPNVVRGGSQSGNIAAVQLIREGLCDALVSDYYYPALAQAAFHLTRHEDMGLAKAWAMISTSPASILRLADRGRIAPGLRADLTIVNRETLDIEATISAGRMTFMTGGAAKRFLASPAPQHLAAE